MVREKGRLSLHCLATARDTAKVLGRKGLPAWKYGFSDGWRAKGKDVAATEQGT